MEWIDEEDEMYKNIIAGVLILAVLGMGFLLFRSCTDNRDYRQQVDELGERIESLDKGYRELGEEAERLRVENSELEGTVGRLRGRIAKAGRIADELSADLQPITGDIGTAKERIRRVVEQIPGVREKLKELKDKLDSEGYRPSGGDHSDNRSTGDVDEKEG